MNQLQVLTNKLGWHMFDMETGEVRNVPTEREIVLFNKSNALSKASIGTTALLSHAE